VSTLGLATVLLNALPITEVLDFFGVGSEDDIPPYITAEEAYNAGLINSAQYMDVVESQIPWDANYTEEDYLALVGVTPDSGGYTGQSTYLDVPASWTIEQAYDSGYFNDEEYYIGLAEGATTVGELDVILDDLYYTSFNNGWDDAGVVDDNGTITVLEDDNGDLASYFTDEEEFLDWLGEEPDYTVWEGDVDYSDDWDIDYSDDWDSDWDDDWDDSWDSDYSNDWDSDWDDDWDW